VPDGPKSPKPKKPPDPTVDGTLKSGKDPTFDELNAKFEPLHQKWIEKFKGIYGPPPSELPPLWAVNHTIPLIDPKA